MPLLIQAQSSKPAFPVEAGVIEYLLQVGERLMKNEVQTYEQGECAMLYWRGGRGNPWDLPLPLLQSCPSYVFTACNTLMVYYSTSLSSLCEYFGFEWVLLNPFPIPTHLCPHLTKFLLLPRLTENTCVIIYHE